MARAFRRRHGLDGYQVEAVATREVGSVERDAEAAPDATCTRPVTGPRRAAEIRAVVRGGLSPMPAGCLRHSHGVVGELRLR